MPALTMEEKSYKERMRDLLNASLLQRVKTRQENIRSGGNICKKVK